VSLRDELVADVDKAWQNGSLNIDLASPLSALFDEDK
jgi:hypothetical protein